MHFSRLKWSINLSQFHLLGLIYSHGLLWYCSKLVIYWKHIELLWVHSRLLPFRGIYSNESLIYPAISLYFIRMTLQSFLCSSLKSDRKVLIQIIDFFPIYFLLYYKFQFVPFILLIYFHFTVLFCRAYFQCLTLKSVFQ